MFKEVATDRRHKSFDQELRVGVYCSSFFTDQTNSFNALTRKKSLETARLRVFKVLAHCLVLLSLQKRILVK